MTRRRFPVVAAVVLVLVVVGFVLVTHISFIDESVTHGKGYGFTIGASKREVYSSAQELFGDEEVYIRDPWNGRQVGPLVPFEFDQSGYQKLSDRDVWEFFFEKSGLDVIALTFDSGRLEKIHRHRQPFELP